MTLDHIYIPHIFPNEMWQNLILTLWTYSIPDIREDGGSGKTMEKEREKQVKQSN